MNKYAVKAKKVSRMLLVQYSDGSQAAFDIVELGCDWFRMSNDGFYNTYGFNFNPHNYEGLYELCRKIVHGN